MLVYKYKDIKLFFNIQKSRDLLCSSIYMHITNAVIRFICDFNHITCKNERLIRKSSHVFKIKHGDFSENFSVPNFLEIEQALSVGQSCWKIQGGSFPFRKIKFAICKIKFANYKIYEL